MQRHGVYDTSLEGQFRDSDVIYDNDINRCIVENWMAYTVTLNNGCSLTCSLRSHTTENNRGVADRDVI